MELRMEIEGKIYEELLVRGIWGMYLPPLVKDLKGVVGEVTKDPLLGKQGHLSSF